MARTHWCMAPPPPADELALMAGELGVPEPVARILWNRNLRACDPARRFLDPQLDDLEDAYQMADMGLAVERLREAVGRGEPILVHGDYDVDGVTSTFLMTKALRLLGGEVSFFIPDRLRDGYGLSETGLEEAARRGASLIVTVDCGVTAADPVARALARGMDVIITDHHEPLGPLPAARAVVNPKRPDCRYPFKELAGIGVTSKVVQALFERMRPEAARGFLEEHLDVIALGTIADVVPLVGENRVLAKLGMQRLESTRNAGLVALKETAGLKTRRVDSGHVAFILAPRINAAGRLGKADTGVRLLQAATGDEARELAETLEEDNNLRRRIDEETLSEAETLISREIDFARDSVIVLWSDRWHSGVLGIVASRLVERYCRPTILIALDGDEGRGSGRSLPGLNLWEALQQVQDCLIAYGGHSHAAGLNIERAHLEEFRHRLNGEVGRRLTEEDFCHRLDLDGEIRLDQCGLGLVEWLERLAPWGLRNSEPLFLAHDVELSGWSSVVSRNHLKMVVRQDGHVAECIGFNLGYLAGELNRAPGKFSLAFTPIRNVWQGRERVQLKVRGVQPGA
ncbi:MAG TPA: single-stranded-DNA-specific exonuclease RecJ [Candidatus Saccharimonadales bacterium]|nr:single-stranded-DNA-specific exonuclease RecJ [Candidatus Saccharimonadales bacterium]